MEREGPRSLCPLPPQAWFCSRGPCLMGWSGGIGWWIIVVHGVSIRAPHMYVYKKVETAVYHHVLVLWSRDLNQRTQSCWDYSSGGKKCIMIGGCEWIWESRPGVQFLVWWNDTLCVEEGLVEEMLLCVLVRCSVYVCAWRGGKVMDLSEIMRYILCEVPWMIGDTWCLWRHVLCLELTELCVCGSGFILCLEARGTV